GAPTPLSYAVALRFEAVMVARLSWQGEASRLGDLLNICAALGLGGRAKKRPDTLGIPRGIPPSAVAERLEQLKKDYPEYKTTFIRKGLPAAIVGEIRRTARAHFTVLVAPARALIGERYRKAASGKSAKARWDSLAAWLRTQTELAAWEELALVLLRLDEPEAKSPVDELRAFLGKESFTIRINRIQLVLPDRDDLTPKAEARLEIKHRTDQKTKTLLFKQEGMKRD